MTQKVTVVEVGPRDGLQAEAQIISPAQRTQLITLLKTAGLACIEVGSFVSPKAVPQMAETHVVLESLKSLGSLDPYMVLVPNDQGFQEAARAHVKQIAFFTAVSQTFVQRNIQCSIEESLLRLKGMMPQAKAAGMRVRGYISCIMGCPYEGDVPPAAVVALTEQLLMLGCDAVSLGDTIGVGTPHRMRNLLKQVKQVAPLSALALHCHDTYGQALPNIYEALSCGLRIFDSSIGGLGGCPYAPGASGNVSTEDLLYMLDGLGMETGVDRSLLLQATVYVRDTLKLPLRSRSACADLKI